MPRAAHITGLDRVLRNLDAAVRRIENRAPAGLLAAALIVERRSIELTPVDTGNLRGSAYAALEQGRKSAVIWYEASYAPFVHEIDANYKKGRWKFLETALREKRREVLEAIRKRAEV